MPHPHSSPARKDPSASPALATESTSARRPVAVADRVALGAAKFVRLIADALAGRRSGRYDVHSVRPGQIAGSAPPHDQVRTYWQARRPS
jgi:hypothetical protein